VDTAAAGAAADRALKPFETGSNGGENPYAIQSALQEMMQSLVGIVRTESEMQRALQELTALRARAQRAAVTGHREYNPGWHTSIDLGHLLTVSEAITRSAIERKESRGGHFREDFPEKDPQFARFNIVTVKGPDGTMQVRRVPLAEMPAQLKQIIEEQK
jgi:succinate dehydrogenase / fumarate reductase flavoprotein subunit